MDDHFTTIRHVGGYVTAYCPEHRAVGIQQRNTVHGLNAVCTEARAHDDQVHGVYRTDSGYWLEFSAERASHG
jgi:hypothetical protein